MMTLTVVDQNDHWLILPPYLEDTSNQFKLPADLVSEESSRHNVHCVYMQL